MWVYLRLTVSRDRQNSGCIEALLLGIYNLVSGKWSFRKFEILLKSSEIFEDYLEKNKLKCLLDNFCVEYNKHLLEMFFYKFDEVIIDNLARSDDLLQSIF